MTQIIQNQKKKIPDTTDFVKKTEYNSNSKISEIGKKIPSISGLVTISTITAVENEIPNVSNLVKKMTITFDKDGSQNYLVFQPNNTLTPSVNYYGVKGRLRFTGSALKQKTVTYSYKKVVNIYVVYEIDDFQNVDNYPTLRNVIFGAAKLTKNTDIEKYIHFGYGIGFDGHGSYSHPSGGNGRNVIIFGVD